MAALAPHLPEARDARRWPSTTATASSRQRAAGGDGAYAPLYPGARAALEPAGRPSRRRCSASPPARRGAGLDHVLRGPRPRPLLRDHARPPTPTRPSRIPRCSWPRSPRPAARRRGGDGRRHRVRHRHGPRRRHGDDRRGLGLPPARAARGGRRRRDHRRLRRARRGARPARGPRAMSWPRRAVLAASPPCRAEDGGFARPLDDRPLRTPAGAPLVVPTEALAAAIAAEWDALEGEIAPDALPLTRAANVGDRPGRAPARGRWSTRSPNTARPTCSATAPPSPTALAARQAAGWDPWLAWAARDARRAAGRGDRRHAPAAAAGEPRRAPRRRRGAGRLRRSPRCTSSSRSPARWCSASPSPAARSPRPTAWELSRIDETWQAEQWGRRRRGRGGGGARGATTSSAPRRLARCSHRWRIAPAVNHRPADDQIGSCGDCVTAGAALRRLTFERLPTKVAAGADAGCPGQDRRARAARLQQREGKDHERRYSHRQRALAWRSRAGAASAATARRRQGPRHAEVRHEHRPRGLRRTGRQRQVGRLRRRALLRASPRPCSAIPRRSSSRRRPARPASPRWPRARSTCSSRNSTWTFTRDVDLKFTFAGVNYYDGQGFMVPQGPRRHLGDGARRRHRLHPDRHHDRAQPLRLLQGQRHHLPAGADPDERRGRPAVPRPAPATPTPPTPRASRRSARPTRTRTTTSSCRRSSPRSRSGRWCARATTSGPTSSAGR